MDFPFGPLDAFAFVVFAVLIFVGVIIVVNLGKLPGQLAHKWNHPQAGAINAMSWIGIATGGLLWPNHQQHAFAGCQASTIVGRLSEHRLSAQQEVDNGLVTYLQSRNQVAFLRRSVRRKWCFQNRAGAVRAGGDVIYHRADRGAESLSRRRAASPARWPMSRWASLWCFGRLVAGGRYGRTATS